MRRTARLDACERADVIVIQPSAGGDEAGGRPVWLGRVDALAPSPTSPPDALVVFGGDPTGRDQDGGPAGVTIRLRRISRDPPGSVIAACGASRSIGSRSGFGRPVHGMICRARPRCRSLLSAEKMRGERVGNLTLRKEVPQSRWVAPAESADAYAEGETPKGLVSLTREPGPRRNPEDIANRTERWTLSLRGEPRIVIDRLGVPGYLTRRLLSDGLDGTVDGTAFRISARSALLPSHRYVALRGDSIDVAFVPCGVRQKVVEQAEIVGVKPFTGGWELREASDAVVLATCLFEWAMWIHFLRTPVVRATL
ncbi:hypothetical protein [Streptomyces sp. NPDC002185]|uniref:hypothetical protein n=1 Tax=Streptomyces sp. NPDC002185 TaxID=3364636 RepID=UPI0036ABDD52